MTISTSAFGKASAFGSHRLCNLTTRLYSTSPINLSNSKTSALAASTEATTQRELFVNVLTANATRRDAKPYLARFKDGKLPSSASQTSPNAQVQALAKDQDSANRSGVNLGNLYGPTRAIADNPQFVRRHIDHQTSPTDAHLVHSALVLVRVPQAIDEDTLDGVLLTLSQLVKLDMRILIVLDCHGISDILESESTDVKERAQLFAAQAERLSAGINRHSSKGARIVQGALEIQFGSIEYDTGIVGVSVPDLLLDPLKRGTIPIVPTLAYTLSGQLSACTAASVMSTLTVLLSGASRDRTGEADTDGVVTSLDRIILLDELGGTPSKSRRGSAHVFVNLEEEFNGIVGDLTENSHTPADGSASIADHQHIDNLQMLRDCLAMLPSASSALIISPEEAAASSSQTTDMGHETIGTGTRRQKNILIHNLLTNKPMVSPSLPVARISSATATDNDHIPTTRTVGSTLVKRGMPLTMVPPPLPHHGWMLPPTGTTTLDLETDPEVDLARLVYLIEDSFRRKLNVSDYLNRIRGRVAGLIVAGSYEGGAILTWEQPPGTTDPSRLVPYLDKFAVLSSSQGSAGVADFLFQAMVQTCFPHGVCWRSRKDNPVNKWYFERADGHWKIPGTNWTMFWTGQGVVENRQRWEDYVSVCRSIEANWKDGKRPD